MVLDFCTGRVRGGRSEAVFEMLEHIELLVRKRGFKSVGKANEKMLFHSAGRSACHHTHRATRMHERVVRAARLDERDNLRARENVVRLV